MRGRRTVGVTLIQNLPVDPQAPEITERRSLDYPNPSKEDSPPVFLYAFPRDWKPATLTLTIAFLSGDVPAEVYGFYARNFIEASFAEKRYKLDPVDGSASCRFVSPDRTHLYCIMWRVD